MLVLARERNQHVIIDDVIAVTVCEIRGDKVRLGFSAPNSVKIFRHEVWATINGRPHEVAARTAAGGEQGSSPDNLVRPILPDGFTRP
jgi:carbon storage regulator